MKEIYVDLLNAFKRVSEAEKDYEASVENYHSSACGYKEVEESRENFVATLERVIDERVHVALEAQKESK